MRAYPVMCPARSLQKRILLCIMQINCADTDLQLVEDVAVDLGIFEGGTVAGKRCRLICSSAKKLKKHKALAMSFNFSAEFCQPPTSSPEIARACHFQNCWQSLTSQLSSSGEGCPDDALVSREIRAFVMCAKHVQQLGGESPLPSLMETKG
jgi:hypothetical protein